VLDVHSDPDHNRSVLTLAGAAVEEAVRAVALLAVKAVDLGWQQGVHPRFGALDVVPFVPLDADGAPRPGLPLATATAARDRFAAWAGDELALPCFLYGTGRTLPEVRRGAFTDLLPDSGPPRPHPSAGACAVGARPPLVAYNLWLDTADLDLARALATALRRPAVRTLGLPVAGVTQVSSNLLEPWRFGPAEAYDTVSRLGRDVGVGVRRAELVGLAPRSVVDQVPRRRWRTLDLDLDRTVEARLAG
jgi:glutamate formiminotransferase